MEATEKMIEFAQSIADALCLPEPDYDDFDEVSDFLLENKTQYYVYIKGW